MGGWPRGRAWDTGAARKVEVEAEGVGVQARGCWSRLRSGKAKGATRADISRTDTSVGIRPLLLSNDGSHCVRGGREE